MESQLIVDGRVVALDGDKASLALERLESASPGDVLVALSFDGRVLVRWVEAAEAAAVAEVAASKPKAPKPTKKRCQWLYDNVETEFDHVVTEHGPSLEELYSSVKDEMLARGKRPESYRRWLHKVKKRWVRTVVAHGRRVDDLETLASGT